LRDAELQLKDRYAKLSDRECLLPPRWTTGHLRSPGRFSLSEVKCDDVGVLNDAGSRGWELVAILPNSMAYMKREVGNGLSEKLGHSSLAMSTAKHGGMFANGNNGASMASLSEVKAKYRDPKTNETWSGRGRMATWLKRKQDAGEDIDRYLV
jgi:hypothetical protein